MSQEPKAFSLANFVRTNGKKTARAVFDVVFDDDIRIKDCRLHENEKAGRWIGMPAKPVGPGARNRHPNGVGHHAGSNATWEPVVIFGAVLNARIIAAASARLDADE